MEDELRSKLETHTVRAGHGPYEPFEHVIVVPFGEDVAVGFARARALAGRRVLVIGHGCTLPGTWPNWINTADGLTMRELGAYRIHKVSEPTEPLRQAIARWTDRIFAFSRIRGADALYAATSGRLLMVTLDTRGIAQNIAHVHRGQSVEIVARHWSDLAQELEPARRESHIRRAGARLVWAPALAATWAGALLVTLRREVDAVRTSRRSIREVVARRSRRSPNPKADTWVVAIPDLMRVNRHVIDGAAIPLLREGRLRGVLLAETLADGLRTETRFARHSTDVLWPGLAALREYLDEIEVDQIVRGETPSEIAGDVLASLVASSRTMARLAISGPWIPESEIHEHSLFGSLRDVAALTTADVFRAVMAQRATERAVKRRSFDGQHVIFVSSSSSSLAPATAVMNAAGATTIDFFHGAAIAMTHGPVESPAQIHLLWTQTDAAAFQAIGCRATEGGMSVRVKKAARREDPRRVLIMSNYAHRDELLPFSFPLQDELLRIVALAPPGFELRWRPHPADQPHLIQKTLERIPPVEISPNPALEDDVAWADYIVSSLSSAVIEALFAEIPAFVHVPPHFAGLHVHSFVLPERAFFRAEELWPKLLTVDAAMRRGDEFLVPEREARARLFGADGRPHAIDIDRIVGVGPP